MSHYCFYPYLVSFRFGVKRFFLCLAFMESSAHFSNVSLTNKHKANDIGVSIQNTITNQQWFPQHQIFNTQLIEQKKRKRVMYTVRSKRFIINKYCNFG